jgi:hypothetical protein
MVGRVKLGTRAAFLSEFATYFVVMTSSCKWIHIVERPDDWKSLRNLLEERSVVDKAGNPMKIQDVRCRQLPQGVGVVLASIIGEKCRTRRARGDLRASAF